MKTHAWHSTQSTDPNVYHDNDSCIFGNHVDAKKRNAGTDDRPKCPGCDQLNGDDSGNGTFAGAAKYNGNPDNKADGVREQIDSFYQGWE